MRHINMTALDDIYYVRLVKNGDANAFVYIVRRYQRMIFSIVNRIIVNEVDAEDITQEIFIKVYSSIAKFREESEFSTWLYRIAYNTAISEARKIKREFTSIDDWLENRPENELSDEIEEVDSETRMRYLEMVLKGMSPEDVLLISLYYMDNRSVKDISEITGFSGSNVKVKLYRIRKYMNMEINKLLFDGK
jgi:RNA polymerase sigma factor, sigma-70 family